MGVCVSVCVCVCVLHTGPPRVRARLVILVGRVALSCVASLSAPLSVSSSDESVFGSSSSASLSSSSDSDSVSGGAASWFLRLILYAPRSSHLRCKKLLALALVDGLWLLASSLIVVA